MYTIKFNRHHTMLLFHFDVPAFKLDDVNALLLVVLGCGHDDYDHKIDSTFYEEKWATHNFGNCDRLIPIPIFNFISIILPSIICLVCHANKHRGCSGFEFTISLFTRFHKEKTGNCSIIRLRFWRCRN